MANFFEGVAAFFAHQPARQQQYDRDPVPAAARLGFGQPALVWCGFGIAYICAVIGGTIQQGLGMPRALYAIALGNAILFVYSSLIAYPAARWGYNFPLMVKEAFGTHASKLPMVVLAILVTGWYAFQAWLTADVIRVAFNLSNVALVGVMAALFGVLFALPTVFGIKSMADVMKVAAPALGLLALYWIFFKILPAGSRVLNSPGTGEITFMTGVAMAWSTFVVSGTMTGDIVRWARGGGQGIGVTAVAFLFSNMPFMILGALTSAAINDPKVIYFFDSSSLLVVVPLLFIAFFSNWSTCDACLYNATMGFCNVSERITWRRAATVGAAIGIIAAATGIIGNIVNWLILLGLLVPPIGGVIIADYYFARNGQGYKIRRVREYNLPAIVALVLGVAAGYYTFVRYPSILFGLAGIVTSFVVYLVLGLPARRVRGEFVEDPLADRLVVS